MTQSMPYGFNFDKSNKKAKKYKLSKEEKKRLKEFEFLQELRIKKMKDEEMQHFISNDTSSTSKFMQMNSNQSNDYNNYMRANKMSQAPNWPKYPKLQGFNDRKDDLQFENPAIILDDEPKHMPHQTNLKGKNFHHNNHHNHNANNNNNSNHHNKNKEHVVNQNNNNDYMDNMSRDESVVAFSDTIMLKSASQVPVNMQNPTYLYEEQEGSIDLRSEYSFYSKNQAKRNQNEACNGNINKKIHEDKTFCEYKDINSWKDVY